MRPSRALGPLTPVALVVAAALLVSPAAAKGRAKFDKDAARFKSFQYGAMDADGCRAELGRRGITFTPVAKAKGVLAPVRLPKDVGGVVYRTAVPASQRATSPYDVFDCRLVLALSDFSQVLAAHDVDEVILFSAWRPPGKSWPEDKLGTRHPGALAIDAYRFGKRLREGQTEKTWLEVERDFHGTMGPPACGSDAAPPSPDSPESRELRSMICEAADQHLFTSILTPNYDRAHANHVHLEVTPDVTWYLIH